MSINRNHLQFGPEIRADLFVNRTRRRLNVIATFVKFGTAVGLLLSAAYAIERIVAGLAALYVTIN